MQITRLSSKGTGEMGSSPWVIGEEIDDSCDEGQAKDCNASIAQNLSGNGNDYDYWSSNGSISGFGKQGGDDRSGYNKENRSLNRNIDGDEIVVDKVFLEPSGYDSEFVPSGGQVAVVGSSTVSSQCNSSNDELHIHAKDSTDSLSEATLDTEASPALSSSLLHRKGGCSNNNGNNSRIGSHYRNESNESSIVSNKFESAKTEYDLDSKVVNTVCTIPRPSTMS